MIDIQQYIDTLPHWHKHREGHIIKVVSYDKDGDQFSGEFWNSHQVLWLSKSHQEDIMRGVL